jgi:hypothetical protein
MFRTFDQISTRSSLYSMGRDPDTSQVDAGVEGRTEGALSKTPPYAKTGRWQPHDAAAHSAVKLFLKLMIPNAKTQNGTIPSERTGRKAMHSKAPILKPKLASSHPAHKIAGFIIVFVWACSTPALFGQSKMSMQRLHPLPIENQHQPFNLRLKTARRCSSLTIGARSF